MDNQKSILFPIKVHTISILWIFKFFSMCVLELPNQLGTQFFLLARLDSQQKGPGLGW
jgi:hypothetical protein